MAVQCSNNDRMATPTTVKRSRLKVIFRSAHGLRTGWAVLLFLAIAAVVLVVIGHVAFMLHHPLPRRLSMSPLPAETATASIS